MRSLHFRVLCAVLAVLMTVGLCGCDMDVSVATLPQGDTVTTTGNGDGWDGSGKLTTAATTTTAMKPLPTTKKEPYSTTAAVVRDSKYQNDYGIYHTLKGYCFGKVYTVQEWLPVVGYVKDGKVVDTMYTSTTIMPSPNHVYWGDFNTKAEWDSWRAHTYKNLATLNEAAAAVQEQLDLESYKVKVFLTLVNPKNAADNPTYYDAWGSLNGVTMDVSNTAHRLQMIKYMVDSYIAEFATKNYTNIEFAGFYWFDESIASADLDWYNDVTDYVRSKGKITMISPFYKATGWTLCDEAGFDLHSMQSNYFPDVPIGSLNSGSAKRLAANAALINAGDIGGIEVESNAGSKDTLTALKMTLKVGIETGIVNGYHVYYFGGGPRTVYDFCMATDAYRNSCYEQLYKYMHNTLTVAEIQIDPIEKEQGSLDGAPDWV